ncbi:MAG: ATP phosphoribosyltransferase regulatory subunit [Caulobacteraceae bacterium]
MRLEAPVPAEVLAAVRAPFAAAGARTFDAPVVQSLGQYLDLAGEAMRERLFIVQSPGGAEACLRPDFTLSAARAHIASEAGEGRYLYEGHAFRVAPKGEARAEEFLQIGLEVFENTERPAADAAIAALAWRAAAAGGRDDLTMLLGDVALFSAFIAGMDVAATVAARLTRAFSNPRRLRAELASMSSGAAQKAREGERLAHLLAGVSEEEAAAVLDEILALAAIPPPAGRSAAEIVHRLGERATVARSPGLSAAQRQMIDRFLAIEGTPDKAMEAIARLAGPGVGPLGKALEDWAWRLDALSRNGAPPNAMRFSAAFGRAFGYYDGFLFEIRSTALGEGAPVAAGGRYDSLPSRLGAASLVGAVGCTVRPGRAWIGGAA